MNRLKSVLPWIGPIYVAAIFLFTFPVKITGQPESLHIFSTVRDFLGFPPSEALIRYPVAIGEFISALLILIPATRPLGALGALGLMTGAIFFHLASPLGINVQGDGGFLFFNAVAVWVVSALILFKTRDRLGALLGR